MLVLCVAPVSGEPPIGANREPRHSRATGQRKCRARPRNPRQSERWAPPSCKTRADRSLKTEQRAMGTGGRSCGRPGSNASAGDHLGGRECQCTETDDVRICASRRRGSVTPYAGSPINGCRQATNDLDGEFDPGSGRTLAACLTHASRARPNRWQHRGRPSGERVSNT